MNYIILDTEYNQPATFLPNFNTKIHDDCPFELIEIGAVKVNENLEIIDTFRMFIKPALYKILNPRVIRKTKITKDDLKYGFPFLTVMKNLEHWLGENFVLCVWSDSDITEIRKNCSHYGIKCDWIKTYIDVQYEATKYLIGSETKKIRLDKAVTELDIEVENKFHHALDDARYTALIFIKLFPLVTVKIQEEKNYSPKFIDYNTLEAIDIKEIDKNKLKVHCKLCGRFAKNVKTQLMHNRLYWVLGYCEKCNKYTMKKVFFDNSEGEQIKYKCKSKILKDELVDIVKERMNNPMKFDEILNLRKNKV